MKPDLRISVKDYQRGKNLKVLLYRLPYGNRRFRVRMNGSRWPKSGEPVSLSKLMTALRKSLVRFTLTIFFWPKKPTQHQKNLGFRWI